MREQIIYSMKAPYREDFRIKGYSFGKGMKSACILGPIRGNEIQQMYICSQLVKALRELERNGCIINNKEIMVVPCINYYSMNVRRKFWPVDNTDINRMFPGSDYESTSSRIADGLLKTIRDYSYGIQFASFYLNGEFVPHVRMMETGYKNTSLANLFGLPYVVVRKPQPIDKKTLNFNWQNEMTAAFSVYTNSNDHIDEKSAKQAVAAVLRFLTRMGLIKYESHSGYISHIIKEEELSNIATTKSGIFKRFIETGEEVRYGQELGCVIDPCQGDVRETIFADTEGIVFFSHTEPLVNEGDVVYRLIHRLHE